MNKEKIDKAVSTFGYWCATIGIPLCIVGVSIVILSGIFGREQFIGYLVFVLGVTITSLTLLWIVIKLLINDAIVKQNEVKNEMSEL